MECWALLIRFSRRSRSCSGTRTLAAIFSRIPNDAPLVDFLNLRVLKNSREDFFRHQAAGDILGQRVDELLLEDFVRRGVQTLVDKSIGNIATDQRVKNSNLLADHRRAIALSGPTTHFDLRTKDDIPGLAEDFNFHAAASGRFATASAPAETARSSPRPSSSDRPIPAPVRESASRRTASRSPVPPYRSISISGRPLESPRQSANMRCSRRVVRSICDSRISNPRALRPRERATLGTVPLPQNGSATIPAGGQHDAVKKSARDSGKGASFSWHSLSPEAFQKLPKSIDIVDDFGHSAGLGDAVNFPHLFRARSIRADLQLNGEESPIETADAIRNS